MENDRRTASPGETRGDAPALGTFPWSPAMERCWKRCSTCHDVCLRTLLTHCLTAGGVHARPEHVGLMLDCIDICHTAANHLLRRSPRHPHTCAACASICEACALSCEQVGEMEECARACRACAESCREMAA